MLNPPQHLIRAIRVDDFYGKSPGIWASLSTEPMDIRMLDDTFFDTGLNLSGWFNYAYASTGTECQNKYVVLIGEPEESNIIELNPHDGHKYILADDLITDDPALPTGDNGRSDMVQVNLKEGEASNVSIRPDLEDVWVTYQGKTQKLKPEADYQFGQHVVHYRSDIE